MAVVLWLIPVALITAGWIKWSSTPPLFGAPWWRSVPAFVALVAASIQSCWFVAMYTRPSRTPGFAIDLNWFYSLGRFSFILFLAVVLLTIPSRKGTRVVTVLASTLNVGLWFLFSTMI